MFSTICPTHPLCNIVSLFSARPDHLCCPWQQVCGFQEEDSSPRCKALGGALLLRTGGNDFGPMAVLPPRVRESCLSGPCGRWWADPRTSPLAFMQQPLNAPEATRAEISKWLQVRESNGWPAPQHFPGDMSPPLPRVGTALWLSFLFFFSEKITRASKVQKRY